MVLYINIETTKGNEKAYITVDSIENLKKAVTDFVVSKYTWKTVVSFKVVGRQDGPCNSIDKKYYEKQNLLIECRKERYDFSNGSTRGTLYSIQDAVIYS